MGNRAKQIRSSQMSQRFCVFNEYYHPEAAPMRICLVADCLLTSAKILSKQPDPVVLAGILLGLISLSFLMITIPVCEFIYKARKKSAHLLISMTSYDLYMLKL